MKINFFPMMSTLLGGACAQWRPQPSLPKTPEGKMESDLAFLEAGNNANKDNKATFVVGLLQQICPILEKSDGNRLVFKRAASLQFSLPLKKVTVERQKPYTMEPGVAQDPTPFFKEIVLPGDTILLPQQVTLSAEENGRIPSVTVLLKVFSPNVPPAFISLSFKKLKISEEGKNFAFEEMSFEFRQTTGEIVSENNEGQASPPGFRFGFVLKEGTIISQHEDKVNLAATVTLRSISGWSTNPTADNFLWHWHAPQEKSPKEKTEGTLLLTLLP